MDLRNTKFINQDGDLSEAARALADGQLVSFPTETVYGLGANALIADAVKSIFEAKSRPADNPLIVHIFDRSLLAELVTEVPDFAVPLMEAFWPGPLTLVMKKSDVVPYEVSAGLETVAIRIPSHPIALKLLQLAGVPVAAPSANVSGKPSPTCAADVIEDLNGRVDFIVDGGNADVGLESTVLDVTVFPPVILRPGAVTLEQIEHLIGSVKSQIEQVAIPKSPGMKYKHYAPNADMTLVCGDTLSIVKKIMKLSGDELAQSSNKKRIGIMATDQTLPFYSMHCSEERPVVISAGDRSNPSTIAAKIFSVLRTFDRKNVDAIYAEGVDSTQVGEAIMNRLERAASGNLIRLSSDESSVFRILFVCTGNTCRSSMAEGIMKKLASKSSLGSNSNSNSNLNFIITSAGAAAYVGEAASSNAIQAVKELFDIDISQHSARLLTTEMIEESDLVLTMESRHCDFVKRLAPECSYKVAVLSEFVGASSSWVSDPFGGSLETYKNTAQQIFAQLSKLNTILLFH